MTATRRLTDDIRKRTWRWIGYVLRLPPTAIDRIALLWSHDDRRGRPKETWRRTVGAEMKQRNAQDKNKWKDLVEALCALEYWKEANNN